MAAAAVVLMRWSLTNTGVAIQALKLERQQKTQLKSQITRLTVMCVAC